MSDFTFLFELEKQLHSFEVRSSVEKISSLLSSDFFEFGSSGSIWTRQDVLYRLPKVSNDLKIQSWDFRAIELSEEVVQVVYVSKYIGTNEKFPEVLRCSIWRKNSLGWQMQFHQGTPKPS